MWGRLVVCFVFVAVLEEALAVDIQGTIASAVGECRKKFPVSDEDVTNMFHNRVMADSYNLKCLSGCVCQTIEIMGPNYEFQPNNMIGILKNIFSENPQKLQSSTELTTLCANEVNSANVGDKVCERAIVAFKCFEENRVKYNFDLLTFS